MADKDQQQAVEEAQVLLGIVDKRVLAAADDLGGLSLNRKELDHREVEGQKNFDAAVFERGREVFGLRHRKTLTAEDLPQSEESTLANPGLGEVTPADKEALRYYQLFIDLYAQKHGIPADDLNLYLEDRLKES